MFLVHVGLVLMIASWSSLQGVSLAITINEFIYLVHHLSNINSRNNCNWANEAPIKQKIAKEIEIFEPGQNTYFVGSKWLQ